MMHDATMLSHLHDDEWWRVYAAFSRFCKLVADVPVQDVWLILKKHFSNQLAPPFAADWGFGCICKDEIICTAAAGT